MKHTDELINAARAGRMMGAMIFNGDVEPDFRHGNTEPPVDPPDDEAREVTQAEVYGELLTGIYVTDEEITLGPGRRICHADELPEVFIVAMHYLSRNPHESPEVLDAMKIVRRIGDNIEEVMRERR